MGIERLELTFVVNRASKSRDSNDSCIVSLCPEAIHYRITSITVTRECARFASL